MIFTTLYQPSEPCHRASQNHKVQRRPQALGISLVEILVSLAIFSTALVGLFMGMNGVNQAIALSMRRDIEAAYANMLIAQVNPYDRLVESAYDIDSNDCGGVRCSLTIPYSDKIYYTRLVDSDPLAADVKRINVYLYRGSSGGSVYRQFRRELALKKVHYNFAPDAFTPLVFKDPTGQVWTTIRRTNTTLNQTQGSYAAGASTVPGSSGTHAAVSNALTVTDPTTGSSVNYDTVWRSYLSSAVNVDHEYKFPATKDQLYSITIGLTETNASAAANSRLVNVYINDEAVATGIDPVTEAGGGRKPLSKIFTATAMLDTTPNPDMYIIKVRFRSTAGTSDVSFITLERMFD